MPIFLSYARDDAAVVAELYRDLGQVHGTVWMDSRLSGGQAWWDTILEQIRACDLFVIAVSPDSIRSEACAAELQYALALERPLLPVLVRPVAMQLADPAIANTQYVDYREPSRKAAFDLIGAINQRTQAPPLPVPLPVPPPPPMSYMSDFRELVDAPALTYTQQAHLLVDLRGYYEQGGDRRDVALQLIQGLRQRGDIAYAVARDIDVLLEVPRPAVPTRATDPATTSGAAQTSASGPASNVPYGSPTPAPPYPSGPPQPQHNPSYQNPPYQAAQGASAQWTPYPEHAATPPPPGPPPSYPTAGGPPVYPSGPVAGPRAGMGQLSHPKTTTVLVMGILSIVICPVTGFIALSMSSGVLREMNAQPGLYGDRNTVVLGRRLAIGGLILWGVIAVVYLFAVLAASQY